MPPMRRSLFTVAAATVLGLGVAAGPAAASSTASAHFVDLDGVHAPAVDALVDADVVNGCTDVRFCPSRHLTRGQFAALLTRALDLPVDRGGSTRFVDTDRSVHRDQIEALAAAGITSGCASDRFCPDDPIDRGQIATLLVGALDVPAASGERNFTDTSGFHGDNIEALADAGIAAGCNGTEFCPHDTLIRAQGATFLARGLGEVDPIQLAPLSERQAQAEAASAQAPGQRAVDAALGQVGTPYRYGGNSTSGFDCSGLTSWAWKQAGVDIPRTSRDQARAARSISRSELRPGDLIFYRDPVGHVAMYIGDGKIVEAGRSGTNVRVSSTGLSRTDITGYGRFG